MIKLQNGQKSSSKFNYAFTSTFISTPCFCFRKAPLEKRDRDNYTPLLMAAYSGHAESLDALLKKGADYEAVDKNDKTAVYLAAEEDKLDALKVN